ncbi:TonB-dependent receptor [Thermodesulfovibrionales bacterium]|nr:TonB-dependent receptor [Thermodesulfovibrionales bacterium]
MRKLKLVWLVLAGLIVGAGSFSGLSFAEEAYAEEVLVIEEVVVTATRVERPLAHIPASVTVITREEIEKTYAKTVDDFLRREVGVQVRRSRGLTVTGAHTAVHMRGTGATARVLILKDGVPLNTKYTGGVALLNAMSIQDIERIEIVRGAASALYGSSAMGGVINIITRRAEPDFTGNVSLEAGNLDTQIGSLGLRYGAENFALRFATERKQTGGYEYRDPWDPGDDGWRLPEMELNHISVGGDLWLGESLLRVDFDHFTEDALVGTSIQRDIAPETNKYRVGWEMPLFGFGEETVFSIKGYYFDAEYIGTSHELNPATREFDIFRSRTVRSSPEYGIMSQISTVLGNHHLVAGVDFREGSVDHHMEHPRGDRKFEGEQSLYAVFVNNEMHLGERMILSMGLRYDHWENRDGRFYDHVLGAWKEFPEATDSAISPRGGIVYKLTEDTRLRASLGTGFRAPSLFHMYRSGPHGRFYDLGNPELRPEKLDWSYDVGVDMQPHENLNLSLTFYQSRLSDFLEDEILLPGDPGIPHWLDPGGLLVRRMINVGEVDIHGIEAGLEFRFNEKWSAFVNHTFNVSKIREHKIAPAYEGNYLPWSPRHISVVGFTYDNPRLFTLSLSIENKGSRFTGLDNEREVAGFHMVNMRVSRELFGGMEVFANVENLTDEEWMEHPLNIGPPFNLLVGARHTF